MRVLVACEFSGTVRDAFIRHGHDAMSCDLLDTEVPGPHYRGDVRDLLDGGWDLMIAHPPCTHLAVSGNGSRGAKSVQDIAEALDFALTLFRAPIPRIAIEQPVSILAGVLGSCTQLVQPWQFGHGEVKATCFWLKGLDPLEPTNIVPGREARVWKMPPGPNRWRERSRTFPGIAEAMATQWTVPARQRDLFQAAAA